MAKLIKPKKYGPAPWSLADFHAKHNIVLIWHDKGGLGDVLMQRMMFAGIKKLVPGCELVFACLPEYFDAARDHPDISRVVDSRTINPKDYVACYNTCVTIADKYENHYAPDCKDHRSDIWARQMGVTLESHEMHFRLDEGAGRSGREKMERLRKPGTPLVAFAPVSKMATKTLLPWQMEVVVRETADCSLVGIHNKEMPSLTDLGVPGLYDSTVSEWMSYIAAADYVIAVDTAAFHLAGGMKKPLLGVFTFADGKVYGKHFDFVLVQKHRDDGDWECGPCFKFADCPKCPTATKPCLTEITGEMLRAGVREMFERWPVRRTALPVLV